METLRESSRCKSVPQGSWKTRTQTKLHNPSSALMLPAICCVYMSSALGRGTFCTGVLSHDTHHHNTHTPLTWMLMRLESPTQTHCCVQMCDASKQITLKKSRHGWQGHLMHTHTHTHTGRDMNQLLLTVSQCLWKVPSLESGSWLGKG